MKRRQDRELLTIIAAIITGTSGKQAAAAVECGLRIMEEVDRRFPQCPKCGDEVQAQGTLCARCQAANPA